MRIVAVVPMKLNNQRLPQKNIKPFTNGKPLCTYILNTLKSIDEIDDVFVYCSNEEIKQYIPNDVNFLKRPEILDLDTASMTDVLKTFSKDVEADVYVMTHTTAPFISPDSIKKGLEKVISQDYDSALAVEKLQDFMWKDGQPMNYGLDKIPRTQDLPGIYMETSGFYIYKNKVINEYGRRIGNKPYFVEVGKIEAIDIDEYEDFIIADAIYNYMNNKDS